MGEIADDCFDQAMDELYEGRHYEEDFSPFSGRQPKGRRDKVPADRYYRGNQKKGAKKGKQVPFMVEYPSKNTPSDQLPDYPDKLFDTSFLSKLKPKSTWDKAADEEAPF